MPARLIIVMSILVVAGICAAVALAAAPGTTDTSFGTNGVTATAVADDSSAQDSVVAPGGDIYTVGSAFRTGVSNTAEAYVARYLPSGALDTSFGNAGVTIINAGAGSTPETGENGTCDASCSRITLTASGDPVVATDATDGSGHDQVAVFELTAAGALNPAFGSGGVVLQQLSHASTPQSTASGVAVQPNGDVVITGFEADASSNDDELFVERLSGAGVPDATFASDGVYEYQYGIGSEGSFGIGVIVEPSGELTFAGGAEAPSGTFEFKLGRLNANGTVDTGFRSGEVAGPDAPAFPHRFAETPSGDYVIAGNTYDSDGYPEFAAAEFTSDGSLDTSFAGTGLFLQQLAPDEGSELYGLTVEPDGDLDLVGQEEPTNNSTDEAVVRLLPNGSLDPSFATGGVLEAQLGPSGSPYTEPYASVFAADGDLIVGGSLDGAYMQAVTVDSPPSVSFTDAPSAPVAGQAVTFTATAAASSGSAIASIAWDLGSGSFTDATGATATKTFTAAGTYPVRVEVTDGDGLTSTSAEMITVVAAPAQTTPTPTTTPTLTTPTTTTVRARPKLMIGTPKVSGATVTVKLTCVTGPCTGAASVSTLEHLLGRKLVAVTAEASVKVKRRTVTVKLGSVRYSLKAGAVKTVTIKLNAAGRKLHVRYRTLAAKLSVTLTGAKPTTVFTRRLSFHTRAKRKS